MQLHLFFLFWLRLHLSNSLFRAFFCPFSLHADCFMLRRKKGKESKSEECRLDWMSRQPLLRYQFYKSTFIRGGHRGEVEEIGGRRQPKLLFTTLFWGAEYKQVSENLPIYTSTLPHFLALSSCLLHDSSPTSCKACKTQWPRKQLSWPTSKRRWQLWQGASTIPCYYISEEYFSVDQVELLVFLEALRAMTLRNKRTMRSSGGLAR